MNLVGALHFALQASYSRQGLECHGSEQFERL